MKYPKRMKFKILTFKLCAILGLSLMFNVLIAPLQATVTVGSTVHVWLDDNTGTNPYNNGSCNGGNGSENSPIRVTNAQEFDCQMTRVLLYSAPNDEVIIHLKPGSYETEGIVLYQGFWKRIVIKGEGSEGSRPTIRMINPMDAEGDYHVIRTDGWIHSVEIANLILNAGWTNSWGGTNAVNYGDGYKTGGVYAQCVIEGRIDQVKLRNWGAKGEEYFYDSGTEAFGLCLVTANWGKDSSQWIHIEECEVTEFYPARWGDGSVVGPTGYCTAISVATSAFNVGIDNTCTSTSGNQRGSACSFGPTWLAMIQDNYIHDIPRGIALGGADMRHTVFEWNVVENVQVGFNCDTLRTTGFTNNNVTLRYNTFDGCHQGINVGGHGWGTNAFPIWTIEDNDFINMVGWVQNPYPPGSSDNWPTWDESFAIRLNGGNGGYNISNNTFGVAEYDTFLYPPNPNFHGAYNPSLSPNYGYYTIRVISGTDPFGWGHNNGSHTISGNSPNNTQNYFYLAQ